MPPSIVSRRPDFEGTASRVTLTLLVAQKRLRSTQSAPTECTAGNYCPAGATAVTACDVAGYYCPAGTSSATQYRTFHASDDAEFLPLNERSSNPLASPNSERRWAWIRMHGRIVLRGGLHGAHRYGRIPVLCRHSRFSVSASESVEQLRTHMRAPPVCVAPSWSLVGFSVCHRRLLLPCWDRVRHTVPYVLASELKGRPASPLS